MLSHPESQLSVKKLTHTHTLLTHVQRFYMKSSRKHVTVTEKLHVTFFKWSALEVKRIVHANCTLQRCANSSHCDL